MRTLLLHSLLAALLVAPAHGHDITLTGKRDGQTVFKLDTSLPGTYPVPSVSGVVFTVTVHDGNTPDDPDDPDEPDDPTDPLPEGKYKIQRDVRDWAKAVTHPDRAATVVELSKNYRQALPGIIGLVNPANAKEAAQVEQLFRIGVIGSFDDAAPAWQDFNGKLDARVKSLIDGGQVSSVAQFLELMAEVATGLDASASSVEKRAAVLKQLEN